MNTNYEAAIPHHANWIWDKLHNGTPDQVNQCNPQLCLDVAGALESAETCADKYRYSDAAGYIVFAARLVFGVYSETYLHIVRFYS